MAEKIEELTLPSAVITRILKDAIPDGINVSKEARAAVARAASVFVLYTTACASHVQIASQRKTLALSDVFTALEDMLFEDMVDPVKESLEAFHAEKTRKEAAASSPSKASNPSNRGRRKRSMSANARDVDTANILDAEFTNEVVIEEQESLNLSDDIDL